MPEDADTNQSVLFCSSIIAVVQGHFMLSVESCQLHGSECCQKWVRYVTFSNARCPCKEISHLICHENGNPPEISLENVDYIK